MFLKKLDMLSPKITLYYQRKNTHASEISGILTLIAYIFVLCFGIIYFSKFINRENPTAYSFNRYVGDIGTFSFSDFNFFNFIQIKRIGSRVIKEIDFNKIEIIGVNFSLENFNDSGNENIHPYWIYGKCDNDTNITEIEDLIYEESFYKSACIKKFYNPNISKFYDINDDGFEWPVIEHGASHPNFSYFGVMIRRCQNSSFRLKHFGACSPEKEINEYLNQTFLCFNVIDHFIDVLNYKNPITKYLSTVTNKVEVDSYIINNLNFNPGLIKTYDIVFYDNIEEKSTYSLHENTQTTNPTRNSGIIGVAYFWLQNSQQYYERRYQRLQDVLSEIGGFGSIVITIAKCINYFVFRFNMLADTKELISLVLKDNDPVQDNFKKVQSINQLIEENINKKIESNKNIKIFDSRKLFKISEILKIQRVERKNIIKL